MNVTELNLGGCCAIRSMVGKEINFKLYEKDS